MKTFEPKTTGYRELLRACGDELWTLGYGAGTVRLNGAGELLAWLEQRGKTEIGAVNKNDMADFVDYLQTRPGRGGGALSLHTVTGYLFSARLLFEYAERHGLRGGSPLVGLSLPRPTKSERYVATRAEVAKLYAAARNDARLMAMLHLLYGCGLRRTEAERVNVGDLDYAAALLYVRRGKGRKRRLIPLTEPVAAGLKNYHKRDRWRWVKSESGKAFLLNDRGNRMRGGTLALRLKTLVQKSKVDRRITPHGLRHAVATHLVGGGMALERVRDFLGHEHLETTQIYTHAKPAER